MENAYSLEALLDFLNHASQRGLMPAATATALAVAARTVLGVLDAGEQRDLRTADLERVIKRFNNKRAKDFNPASLKEYGQRARRAVKHFLRWQDDPANFSVTTRATKKQAVLYDGDGRGDGSGYGDGRGDGSGYGYGREVARRGDSNADSYDTSVPIRPGRVVELCNIPYDLTKAEAERLVQFVRMLVVESPA